MTILYEIHTIERFKSASAFSSYSRLIKVERESAGKKTKDGNNKIGNPHLKWAFSEIILVAQRWSEPINRYYDAKAKRKHCPDAATVYDPFHLLQIYAQKVIDRVRIDECGKASKDNKAIIRGTKYLLLKNRKNLLTDRDEPARLRDLLAINQRLNTAYILKEDLKRVWIYKRKAWAARWLDAWCQRALDSGIKPLIRFTRKLLYPYFCVKDPKVEIRGP